MKLVDKNGMALVSEDDLRHLQALRVLFKRHRDAVVIMFKLSKENRPITNMLSKLWRISDDILDELRQIKEVEDYGMDNCELGKHYGNISGNHQGNRVNHGSVEKRQGDNCVESNQGVL
jgi:hypothetical protein